MVPPTTIKCSDLMYGERNPRANTAFEGRYMVADVETWRALADDPDYTFEDASGANGWCVVGDDLTELLACSEGM